MLAQKSNIQRLNGETRSDSGLYLEVFISKKEIKKIKGSNILIPNMFKMRYLGLLQC